MWSFGCGTRSSSAASTSVASTSLTFMFVDVPEPVWKMSTGNWSSSSPRSTRSAASAIAAGQLVVDVTDTERRVDRRGMALDRRQGAGDAHVEGAVGDREVRPGELGLLPPQRRVHAATLWTPRVSYIADCMADIDWTRFDAVLFDLDGVLTPTADVHERAWTRMFNEFLVGARRR